MSWHLYMLTRTTHNRTSREVGKVKGFINQMEIPLYRHNFNGKDHIRFLDFVARFTREASIQEMPDTKAFVILPSLLEWFSFSQCVAMAGIMPSIEGELTYWPEAVQFLLANYAQVKVIMKAVRILRNTTQKKRRTRYIFRRMNDAFSRCDNELYQKKQSTYTSTGWPRSLVPWSSGFATPIKDAHTWRWEIKPNC